MARVRRGTSLVVLALALGACGGGAKKAHDASSSSSSSSSSEDSEVQIEYVPIAIAWVKRHVHPTQAELAAFQKSAGSSDDAEAAYKKARAPELARKLADDMLSRMQASSESLDSIAEASIRATLGNAAIADAKRRKAVTLSAAHAGEADLPPDAKEALAAFARKAHPGDVVDSALGSGPVLVVARAAR
jgi:hypothetical protein